jgi:murein DD-endopeptidase MepM/ murein hydrolase activator NlpD
MRTLLAVLFCCLTFTPLAFGNSSKANPKVKQGKPIKAAPTYATPKLRATPNYQAPSYKPYTSPLIEPTISGSAPLPTPNTIENILQTPSPEVVKSSINLGFTMKHGCDKATRSMSSFLRNLSISDNEFSDAFDRQVPNFFKNLPSTCLPYSAAIDNLGKVQAFSIMNNENRNTQTTLVTLHRSPNAGGFLVESQQLGSGFENYLELTMNLNDLVVYKANKATTSIPPELIWELASLVKELYPKINANEQHFARIVYDAGKKDKWAQVISLEILDSTQKHVLTDAFWVGRDDITGGFFTSSGAELEQNFWINPLNYTRISRGVGNFASSNSRPTVIRKGKKNLVVMQSFTSYSGHQGIDFAAPPGTPIYSVANGKIVYYSPMSGYGNLVIVEHPGNYKTYYAHLSAYNPELSVGSEVRRGLEIGYVGSTGHSTGPHLHFELRKNNVYLNPMSNGLKLDLWSLRDSDLDQLTKNIVLFSSFLR